MLTLRRAVLACLLLIGGLVVAGERPARAAGCFATSCEYQFPRDMGCATGVVQLTTMAMQWNEAPNRFWASAKLLYSPACRAVYAEFVTTAWDIEEFNGWNPQIWRIPKYGGVKTLVATWGNFQAVDGTINASPGEIMQSQMFNFDGSLRLCVTEDYTNPDGDPDYTMGQNNSGPSIQCTEEWV